ncbi:MAG TPA: hypothetical protein PKW35_14265 [Nannocystaceae bacterium]|nr:hypothetical protein [Nannocystaceae bacterium]
MVDRDDDERSDRLSSSFRRKLSEGLTGLLDPEGALGKGRDYVAGFAQGTKSEVVRLVASEVRSFLDNMDSVEMLQRVIAGLVVEVKAEIRFSVDKEGKLQPALTRREAQVSGGGAAAGDDERPRPRPGAKADDDA